MNNKFCSYPVSDCTLSPLLASYKQRIDNLQTALGNLELDAILAEVQKLEDAKRIDELETALAKAIEALAHIEDLTCESDFCVFSIARNTLTTLKGKTNE
jgi:hypothetical protein